MLVYLQAYAEPNISYTDNKETNKSMAPVIYSMFFFFYLSTFLTLMTIINKDDATFLSFSLIQ